MSGAGITITVDDAEVQAACNRLAAAAGNLTGAFKNVGEYLVTSTKARFDRQQAPDGTPWAALSPKWLARKKDKGQDTRILVMRGHLMNWLRYQLVGSNELQVGTDRAYGATHQFGADMTVFRKRRLSRVTAKPRPSTMPSHMNIPARPFLGLDETDRARILEIFTDFLTRAEAGANAV